MPLLSVSVASNTSNNNYKTKLFVKATALKQQISKLYPEIHKR